MTCCKYNGGAALNADRVGQWNPIPGVNTAPLSDGVNGPTATGTATARTIAGNPATLLASARRIGYVSAAAINSVGGARAGQQVMINGGTQPAGPTKIARWKLMFTFGISDAVLNGEARMFVGATASAVAPTAVDPATLNQAIGFGVDANETTMRFYAADAGANRQEIDLGAGFPVNTAAAAARLYRILIACRAGATANPVTYDWAIENMDTGVRAAGVVDTLAGPQFNQPMSPLLWRATGPVSALATGIDLVHMRLETDY
jgi:hypothetical protein